MDLSHEYRHQLPFLSFSLAVIFFAACMSTAALAQHPGDLDETFGNGGKVTTGFRGFGTYQAFANGVAIQPDGKIVAAGRYGGFALFRYNVDGSLDSTFGWYGIVVTQGYYAEASALAIQPDGKIVAAGRYLYNEICDPKGNCTYQWGFALVRYNTDGSLDSTFDTDGKVNTNIGEYSAALAIAIQPDGKILAAGYGSDHFALVRYDTNGSLDPAFDGDGIVTTDIDGHGGIARAVAVQRDGKIVAAGGSNGFALVRYNMDGSLDPTFGGDGVVTTNIGDYGLATAVAIQPDGKILAAGEGRSGSNYDFSLVRYNTDGAVDPTFDGDGIVTTNVNGNNDHAKAAAIQPDGKIVVAGASEGANFNFTLVRYNTNGSLDTTFAHGDGIKVFDFNNSDDSASAIALDGQGRAVIAGGADIGPDHPYYDFAVARLWLVGTTAPDNTPFDFDGDARSDISVFRPSEGNWYLERSQNGFVAVNFGLGTDKIVPADYDGDGKADIAVYRPSIGYWYVLRSSNGTFFYTHLGTAEDLPAPADFDNDGRADVTIYNPSAGMWSIKSTSWGLITANFGTSEDIPVVGDYNGDGHADLAVFRPSNGTWYWSNDLIDPSHNFVAVPFGLSNDLVTPADFDADGRTDIAVYRPSTGIWYSVDSSNGGFRATQFGTAEDVPAAADFDGDGRADVSVFRPSNGVWYRLNSGNGSFFAAQFGNNGDKPTPAAFRY